MLFSSSTPARLKELTSLSSCFTLNYSGLHAHGEMGKPHLSVAWKSHQDLKSLSFRGRRVALECWGENSLRTLQEFLWALSVKRLIGQRTLIHCCLLCTSLSAAIVWWRKENCCVDDYRTVIQKRKEKFVLHINTESSFSPKQQIVAKALCSQWPKEWGVEQTFLKSMDLLMLLCVPTCSLKPFIKHNTWHWHCSLFAKSEEGQPGVPV